MIILIQNLQFESSTSYPTHTPCFFLWWNKNSVTLIIGLETDIAYECLCHIIVMIIAMFWFKSYPNECKDLLFTVC